MEAQVIGILSASVALSTVLGNVLLRVVENRFRNGRNGSAGATVENLRPFHERQTEMLGSLLEHLEGMNVNQREMAMLMNERSKDIVRTADDVKALKAILTDRERQAIHNRIDELTRLVGEMRKEKAA